MRPVSTRSRSRSATSRTGPRSLPPSCRSPRRAPCRPAPAPAAEKERGKRSEGTVCSLLLLSASRPFGRTGEALCGSEPQSGSSPARAPCEAAEPTRERENLTRERARRLVALSHKADSSDARLRGLREHGRRAEALEDRLTLAERRGLSAAAQPAQGVRPLHHTPLTRARPRAGGRGARQRRGRERAPEDLRCRERAAGGNRRARPPPPTLRGARARPRRTRARTRRAARRHGPPPSAEPRPPRGAARPTRPRGTGRSAARHGSTSPGTQDLATAQTRS